MGSATSTIPIVIAVTGDAVATGLVQGLARPGGNLTGTSFFLAEVNAKRVELLKEALPGLKRVAVLMNATNPANVVTFDAMARTARTVSVDAVQVRARSADDFDAAFAQITKGRAEAVALYEDPLFIAQAARLAALAERHRLPSIGFREYADAGGSPRLRGQPSRRVAAGRRVRRSDLQGRPAVGPPDGAAGEV